MFVRKIMPTTLLLMAIILMIALHLIFPIWMVVPRVWNLLGLILLALGVWINLWTDRAFHQAQTSVKPYETPSTLIVYGLFNYTRNPMYLGFVFVLMGIAVLLGSLLPWAVVPLYILTLDRLYIPHEEKTMAAKFGALWEGYKKTARRWI
jgi:protein-S-isoprenylcysteine O-methyltransferase Ste14